VCKILSCSLDLSIVVSLHGKDKSMLNENDAEEDQKVSECEWSIT
jgi:hypothetical protein